MLPDNFDFALLPTGSASYSLQELGMLSSKIEDIDRALVTWVKDLQLSSNNNEGFTKVPVLWQAPERSYQIKHEKELRDDAGALKLPIISIERTGITKDPARKGSFQAHYYSKRKNGRSGRFVVARRIVPKKTQNFAIASGTRHANITGGKKQQFYPRRNQKVVVQSLSIPIPVYVNLDYKIVLKAEYQQQINQLVQPFLTRTGQINAFNMHHNGHIYEAFIQQGFASNNNVSNLAEDMRMFSSEITINVLGYLIGEGENDDRPIVRIDENVVEYIFPSENEVPIGNATLFGEQE